MPSRGRRTAASRGGRQAAETAKRKEALPPVPVTSAETTGHSIDLTPLALGSAIPGWHTRIPELLLSPFSEDDFKQVKECLKALAPIERQGMKLATRIELSAALIVSACEHGFEAAEEMGGQGHGAEFFGAVQQLIIRRAREIYGQGGA